jgi:putative ABC transport system permease protein
MRYADYVTGALSAIWAAKLRTFLTALGMIIGVGSVVLLLGLGAGVEATITGSFADLGSTRITVQTSAPGATVDDGPGGGGGDEFGGAMVASTLTVADAAALSAADGVAAVAPVIQVPVLVSGPTTQQQLAVTGTTPDYAAVTNQELVAGRMFAADAPEAVLNEAAATALVGSGEAVGSTLTIAEQIYTVVGVVRNETPPSFGPVQDAASVPAALFMPVDRALTMAGTEYVAQIILTAESPEQVDAALASVQRTLAAQHGGVEDFALTSAQELQASFTQIFDVITLFLAAIAGISLVVGGIGIMNIMLASVTERTREIGIAKAIGATRGNVVVQFLAEAVVLSVLGGVLGLLLAWVGTLLVSQFLGLAAVVTLPTVALAVGVSVAIGIFFGVVPAWRAARLDPIIALRHE